STSVRSSQTLAHSLTGAGASASEPCESLIEFYSPIAGLTPDQFNQRITSGFALIRQLPGQPARPHPAIDAVPVLNDPNSKKIVAVASGWIYAIGWSHTTGRTVVVQHEKDGFIIRSGYHHLVADSVHIADGFRGHDVNGNPLEKYPAAAPGEKFPPA